MMSTSLSSRATSTLPSTRNQRMYLVITNISKRNNVKSLLQTAAACGCAGVFVVGQRNFDFESRFDAKEMSMQTTSSRATTKDASLEGGIVTNGCVPPSAALTILRFDKWKDFVNHLMEQNILLVGVEIHPDAVNVDDFDATGNGHDGHVAFLMGNEGQGIHEKHMASCQAFVKIPQYGNGTASLNVNVAASIILHSQHLKLRNCYNT